MINYYWTTEVASSLLCLDSDDSMLRDNEGYIFLIRAGQ
jgi:hypothetical protein